MGWAPNWVGVSRGVAAPGTSITAIATISATSRCLLRWLRSWHLQFVVGHSHGRERLGRLVQGRRRRRGPGDDDHRRGAQSKPSRPLRSWSRPRHLQHLVGRQRGLGRRLVPHLEPHRGPRHLGRGDRPQSRPSRSVRRWRGHEDLQHLVGRERRVGRQLVQRERRRRRSRHVDIGADPQSRPHRPLCRRSDHGIYSTWWDANGGWANWFHVAGGVAAPNTSVAAVARTPPIWISSSSARTRRSTASGGTPTAVGRPAGST